MRCPAASPVRHACPPCASKALCCRLRRVQGEGEGEGGAAAEVAAEAAGICDALDCALEAWELRRLLGGPYDDRGAVLTIQVGAAPASLHAEPAAGWDKAVAGAARARPGPGWAEARAQHCMQACRTT